MTSRPVFTAAVALAIAAAMPALAQTEISWWHAMAGANNEVVEKIAGDFNASQSDYKLSPVFKGTYPETLNAGIAAFRAGQAAAHHAGVRRRHRRDDGRRGRDHAGRRGADRGRQAFDKSQYLPGIVAYYSTPDGTMLSFPYNSSSPILYYNKDIFEKAGLDVDNPPKTWPEVWEAAKQIEDRGAATCGYTSAWLTWIHLENFAAWNNLPYATQRERTRRPDIELQINAPIFVKHFQEIADLAEEGVFRYGGRTSEAKQLFLAGECGIYDRLLGRHRRHRQVGHGLRHRPAALRPRAAGRAAEHHPRRRQPLGVRRQVARGLRRRRRVLRVPVADRRAVE